MPYSVTVVPGSATFTGGLLINNAAMVAWQGDASRQIYLYRNGTGLTEKISNNTGESRAGIVHHMNDAGAVVWDTIAASGYIIMYYDGSAAEMLDVGGQNSGSPDINANGIIVFARYGWYQMMVFECQLATWTNGNFNRLLAWPGNRYAIINPRINNNGQIAFILYDGEAKLYEIHLFSNGTDKTIGGPFAFVQYIQINSNGWVVWNNETSNLQFSRGIYLYNGTETKKISPDDLFDSLAPDMNDAGQVVYSHGGCDAMDIYVYAQGVTQKLSASAKFNYDPRINNGGHIVWWSTDQWDSPETGNICHSLNGAAAEQIAVSGALPCINVSGQIAYWDANAKQLILLTPSSHFFILKWFLLLIQKLIRILRDILK